MGQILIVAMMVATGALIGMQSPINAALAKKVGVLESATLSFTVGTIALLLVALIFGKGDFRGVTQTSWWHWLGGFMGAAFVTSMIVAVPRVGVTAIMVAALTGQLLIAMAIDTYGWFGLQARPLEWQRVVGVLLMFAAVWLMYGKRV